MIDAPLSDGVIARMVWFVWFEEPLGLTYEELLADESLGGLRRRVDYLAKTINRVLTTAKLGMK